MTARETGTVKWFNMVAQVSIEQMAEAIEEEEEALIIEEEPAEVEVISRGRADEEEVAG